MTTAIDLAFSGKFFVYSARACTSFDPKCVSSLPCMRVASHTIASLYFEDCFRRLLIAQV